jgi:hypothetical protein
VMTRIRSDALQLGRRRSIARDDHSTLVVVGIENREHGNATTPIY